MWYSSNVQCVIVIQLSPSVHVQQLSPLILKLSKTNLNCIKFCHFWMVLLFMFEMVDSSCDNSKPVINLNGCLFLILFFIMIAELWLVRVDDPYLTQNCLPFVILILCQRQTFLFLQN